MGAWSGVGGGANEGRGQKWGGANEGALRGAGWDSGAQSSPQKGIFSLKCHFSPQITPFLPQNTTFPLRRTLTLPPNV